MGRHAPASTSASNANSAEWSANQSFGKSRLGLATTGFRVVEKPLSRCRYAQCAVAQPSPQMKAEEQARQGALSEKARTTIKILPRTLAELTLAFAPDAVKATVCPKNQVQ